MPSELHYGNGWDLDDDDWDELYESQKKKLKKIFEKRYNMPARRYNKKYRRRRNQQIILGLILTAITIPIITWFAFSYPSPFEEVNIDEWNKINEQYITPFFSWLFIILAILTIIFSVLYVIQKRKWKKEKEDMFPLINFEDEELNFESEVPSIEEKISEIEVNIKKYQEEIEVKEFEIKTYRKMIKESNIEKIKLEEELMKKDEKEEVPESFENMNCPECGHLNSEYSDDFNKIVKCANCGIYFKSSEQ